MAGGAFDGLVATILELDEKDRLVVLMDPQPTDEGQSGCALRDSRLGADVRAAAEGFPFPLTKVAAINARRGVTSVRRGQTPADLTPLADCNVGRIRAACGSI